MSTSATDPTTNQATVQPTDALEKGKGKAPAADVEMNDEEDEEDDDEEEEDDEAEGSSDEEEEEASEDSLQEIDPQAIITSGRRTRGVKVDYSSAEALAKAGLDNKTATEDDEDDEDVQMKE
ncbi:histone H2A.Z-specific chaperone CHZ1 [Mycena floridula]|nr:histone H2A.Z-specific chaperone CHZ1 [Mycena floridula]